MKIEERRAGTTLIVKLLESQLGADKAVTFKKTMTDFIQRGDTRLVLDISAVEFVDSSGLGAILSVLKQVGTNGQLAICGVTAPVANMFRLTRMDRVFHLYKTAEEALAELG